MCGIFAYIGDSNATKIVFEGLKKLEYRGYDSWGVGAVKNGRVRLEKHVGKIGDASLKLLPSDRAIGHTRWATHGGVTKKNAHPHTGCRGEILVVHNGIIDNYEKIKEKLLQQEHKFSSETDTEIFAHLVEEHRKTLDFDSAVCQAFNELKGLSTIVAMDVLTGEIVAFKNGSPLVVGIDKQAAIYISSDTPSLLSYTNEMVILEDGQGVTVGKGISMIDLKSGKKTKPSFQKIKMAEEKIEKGNFDHFLQKEIYDQQESLLRIASHPEEIRQAARLLKKENHIYAVACGTAAYATIVGSYILAEHAGLQIIPITANEFRTFGNLLKKDDVVIAASQSGETIDTIEALRLAKTKGARTISLVNVPGSTLAREADITIPLLAGVEKAVLSTKAFTSKVSVFLILAHILAGREKEGLAKVEKASKEVKLMLRGGLEKRVKKISRKIHQNSDIYVIGRGKNYAVAMEGALKIKEASYIHAEGFAGGELKHGVIALIEKGTPCIAIVANDEEKSDILSGAMELKARGAHIIGIGPEKESVFDDWIEVPDDPTTSPILNVIPFQLLGYHLALLRKADPDKPRNLAKSVTVK